MQVQYEPWDYKNEIEDLWGVTITDGEFAGTSISFNSMDLKEDSSDLQLDYTVVKVAPGKEKSEVKGPEFEKALQFIVQDILEKAIEHYGEDNTTKSGQ